MINFLDEDEDKELDEFQEVIFSYGLHVDDYLDNLDTVIKILDQESIVI